MAEANEVADFYDQFIRSRMVSYRIDGNKRLDAAKQLASEFVAKASNVADIGCGIGIVSEAVAASDPSNMVVGIDLSAENIKYAKKTIDLPNVQFHVVDITEQMVFLNDFAVDGIDACLLIDVIEHIPEHSRSEILKSIYNVTADGGRLIISYPSAEYQRFLYDQNPEELQVIDHIIETDQIISEATNAGWDVKYFKKIDVWRTNQYCHLVLQKSCELESLKSCPPSLFRRLQKRIDAKFFRPRRKRKYAELPFWERP